MRLLGLAVVCAFGSILAAPAHSTPVTWTLQNIVFGDGGTASGSFTYDADTNTYSAVDITTTAGSILGGATYVAQSPGQAASSRAQYPDFVTSTSGDLTNTFGLNLSFQQALTDAGGTVALVANYSLEAWCGNATCSSIDYFYSGTSTTHGRQPTQGAVVAAVPEPAPVTVYVAGLLTLGLVRRVKRRSRTRLLRRDRQTG